MNITSITYRKEPSAQGLKLIGKRYGWLIVVKYMGSSNKGSVWECLCDCGNKIASTTGTLQDGRSKSCGCKKNITSGSHKLSGTRIYRIWQGMRNRCNNKNFPVYPDYGGRGIGVSKEWDNSFINFYNDMKEGYYEELQLDRIDNNKGYCKENCKWSTRKEQCSNRRDNFWYEIDGVRLIKADWARKLGIDHNIINTKMRKGYTFKDIYDHYINKPKKLHA